MVKQLKEIEKMMNEETMKMLYRKGYHDGVENTKRDFEFDLRKAREDGLNAAWEAARKLFSYVEDGGFAGAQIREIFGEPTMPRSEIFNYYSVDEVIKKIKEYESHVSDKDVGEIKIGDEVTLCGQIGVVSEEPHKIGHNQLLFARVWFAVGSSSTINVESLKKTGKHYPEIAEVLRMMKNESN